jgi:uncharacterized protein with HEPN domain
MKRDEELLVDLLSYAKLAVRRAGGRSQDELIVDKDLQSLLIHPLLVIGEAVKNLSLEFRQGSQEIPWERIAGMRDRLIHAYDRVDWKIVWETVTLQLPTLINFLERRGVSE